jgi:hypothetical protein
MHDVYRWCSCEGGAWGGGVPLWGSSMSWGVEFVGDIRCEGGLTYPMLDAQHPSCAPVHSPRTTAHFPCLHFTVIGGSLVAPGSYGFQVSLQGYDWAHRSVAVIFSNPFLFIGHRRIPRPTLWHRTCQGRCTVVVLIVSHEQCTLFSDLARGRFGLTTLRLMEGLCVPSSHLGGCSLAPVCTDPITATCVAV